eukprot:TRINITY_DN5537_c0_g1_i1.p1 TRINITY_DN5537_c0_g1~~TRINITY_DN5537_c0_g1_i1.p1  ORF type:complete len:682 (-),score=300.76 TRINITY_DN5537_c0_g1_i1:1732-3777(-)
MKAIELKFKKINFLIALLISLLITLNINSTNEKIINQEIKMEIEQVEVGPGVCDPIQPQACIYPFPNNFWTRQDSQTKTLLRLNFSQFSFPLDERGQPFVTTNWNQLDGFSTLSTILSLWNNPSIQNIPSHSNIEHSLEKNCPTVILDTVTGERVAHWGELDESYYVNRSSNKALLLWPTKKLEHNRRYIVGISGLYEANTGLIYKPSDAFKALRDNLPSNDPDINSRRDLFEDIFSQLEKIGISRSTLQLAWDFTTGSKESITGRLLFIRDDAIQRLPADGPNYHIKRIEHRVDNYTEKFIHADVEVPLYLTTNRPGGVFVLDENQMPVFQSFTNVSFSFQIPTSLARSLKPGRTVQYGHGLFGSQAEIKQDFLQKLGYEKEYNLVATNWWGLSEEDIVKVAEMIALNLSNFDIIPDRCQQGVLNNLILTKLLKSQKFINDPTLNFLGHSVIDPNKIDYYGNSLGGIMGSVVMGVSQDLLRGVLGVPGTPFSLLLPRSTAFQPFFDVLKLRYQIDNNCTVLFSLLQLLWDRSEPVGYMDSITNNPLPNTPEHMVIMHYGLGDALVTWLGALTLGRSVGAKMFPNNVREANEQLYGFDTAFLDISRGAIIQGFDFGAPPVPQTNHPANPKTNTHGCVRRDPRTQDEMDQFFKTGTIYDACEGNGCYVLDPPIYVDGCPLPI